MDATLLSPYILKCEAQLIPPEWDSVKLTFTLAPTPDLDTFHQVMTAIVDYSLDAVLVNRPNESDLTEERAYSVHVHQPTKPHIHVSDTHLETLLPRIIVDTTDPRSTCVVTTFYCQGIKFRDHRPPRDYSPLKHLIKISDYEGPNSFFLALELSRLFHSIGDDGHYKRDRNRFLRLVEGQSDFYIKARKTEYLRLANGIQATPDEYQSLAQSYYDSEYPGLFRIVVIDARRVQTLNALKGPGKVLAVCHYNGQWHGVKVINSLLQALKLGRKSKRRKIRIAHRRE